ncbi:MAG TPA: hypothetical protein PLC04_03605 [Candidatus Kapabacteria bacterium]|nr:hypothetical protein [Candidatus Kapabacteria bacterium]
MEFGYRGWVRMSQGGTSVSLVLLCHSERSEESIPAGMDFSQCAE